MLNKIRIVLALLFVFSLIGCSNTYAKEEYDSLENQLKSTRIHRWIRVEKLLWFTTE